MEVKNISEWKIELGEQDAIWAMIKNHPKLRLTSVRPKVLLRSGQVSFVPETMSHILGKEYEIQNIMRRNGDGSQDFWFHIIDENGQTWCIDPTWIDDPYLQEILEQIHPEARKEHGMGGIVAGGAVALLIGGLIGRARKRRAEKKAKEAAKQTVKEEHTLTQD